MKVYLVGVCNCESTDTRHICLSKETALKRWEEIRLGLIVENRELWESYNPRIYLRIDKNLQETDHEKMNNYPQDQPFIREIEVEE